MDRPARRRLRLAMTVSTALTGGAAFAGVANAQSVSLPDTGRVGVTVSGGSLPGVLPSASDTLKIGLNATSTVITWNGGFNIPTDKAVAFVNGPALLAAPPASVLNIDKNTAGNNSQLLGRLTSDPNIAVWIYNPNGIVVGSKAVFNTGSLVLTTLAPPSDFVNNGAASSAGFRLADAAGSAKGITVQAGANITVTSGNRGLVLVAPQINATGTFDAGGQDAAFVVASDVTINYAAGSPLSITLNKGTVLADAASHLVRSNVGGTVKGQNALFAIASQGSVNDALLGVDASVTTASATGRGIVLSAGTPAAPVDGVGLGGTASDIGGTAGLTVTGALKSAARASIGANGAVSVTGDVTAASDYQVSGGRVTLGGGTGPVAQTAGGAVTVTATNGAITGASSLTLTSAAAGGAGALSLVTAGPGGTDIKFADGSRLLAGNNGQATLAITLRDATINVSLGDVTAGALTSAIGTATQSDGLSIGAALTLGNVKTHSTLALSANGISAGSLTSDAGVTLNSSAGLSVGPITARFGSATLGGTGSGTTVTGTITASDGVNVTRGGAVSLDAVDAGGDVIIGSSSAPVGSLHVSETLSGRVVNVTTGGQQIYGGAITASDGLTAKAGGLLSVSNATAGGTLSLTGTTVSVQQATSNGGSVRLLATTGGIDANKLGARGDVVVSAADTATVASDVTAGGNYQVTGKGVTLGSATNAAMQSAAGGVAISAGAGGITGLQQLKLVANSGGGGTGALSLVVTDAAGAIAFDRTSTLAGGSARQSAVTISTVDAGSSLSLGNVTAGSLMGSTGDAAFSTGLTRTAALSVGDISLASDLVLQAPGISAGALSSDGAVTLGGTGPINATSVGASGVVQLTGTGDTTVTNLVSTTGPGGNVAIDRAGMVKLGGFNTSGDVTISNETALTVTGASTIGGGLTATGAATQDWGAITAGTVFLNAPALTLGDVTTTAGDAVLTTTAGNLATGDIGANGALTMNSAGAINAGGVSGSSVFLGTAGAITTSGTVKSTLADVVVNGGTISLSGVNAARDATLTAATGGLAFSGPVSAGRNLTASAPGDVSLNGGTVGGELQVVTRGVASLGGAITAGSLQLTGASVAFRDDAHVTSAGTINVNATTGGISGGSRSILASSSSDPTQFIRLLAAGAAGVNFASDSSISAAGLRVAVFNADPTATLALGAVTARGLVGLAVAGDDPTTMAITLSGAAPVFGALTLGEGFTARATAGDLTVGSLAVGGAGRGIDLAATGALNIKADASADGDVLLASGMPLNLASVTSSSGRVSVTSGGALTVGTLSGAGGVTASGTTLDVGTIRGGAAELSTTAGPLRLGGGQASAAMLKSVAGDISITGALTLTGSLTVNSGANAVLGGGVHTGGDVVLTAIGNTQVQGPVVAGGNYLVFGRAVTLGGAESAGGALEVTTTGGALTGLSNLTLTSDTLGSGNGALRLSTTGGAIALDPASTLNGGNARQSIVAVDAGTNAVALGAVNARALLVNGGVRTDAAITTGVLSLTDPLVVLGGAGGVHTGAVTVSAGGATLDAGSGVLKVDGALQAQTVALTGGQITTKTVTGGDVKINAGTQGLDGGAITATGPVAIASGGMLHLTGLTTTGAGGNVAVAAQGLLTLDAVNASGTANVATVGATPANVVLTTGLTAVGDVQVASTRDIRSPFVTSMTGRLIVAAPNGDAMGINPGDPIALSAATGGGVSVTSGGDLRLGALTGGSVSLAARSISALSIDVGGNSVDLAATGGDLTVGGGVKAGAVTLSATGTTSVGGLVVASGAVKLSGTKALTLRDVTGGSVSLLSGGALTGGTLTGGDVSVSGGSVSLTRVAATGGATLASAGDLTLGGAKTGGDFVASAAGLLTLGGAVTAGGAAQLTGTGGLVFTDVTGGSVSASSKGAVSGGTVTGGAVGVTGGSVSLTGVISTGGATLSASAGDLSLGGATTGGDLAASASGTVTIPGAVTSGGAYLVRGGTVALGANGVTQAARGRVDINSVSGGITGASGLTLVSGSAGGSPAGTLVLDSAGALAFGGTLMEAGPGGGAALGLNAGAGQSVTLGRVEAVSVGGVDAGHSDFSQAFTHAGNVTLGDVAAGRVSITLKAGDLTLGKVTSAGAVTLASAGALSTGGIGAGTVDLAAGNALTAGDVLAAGSAKVAGGDVTLTSLTAGGDLGATARGALTLGTARAGGAATLNGATVQVDSASGGTLAVTATGDLTGRSGGRAALTGTGGDVTVQTGGLARLASLSSAGAATVNAGTVDVSGQLGAARALLVKARQALTVGGATTAGGDATLSAGGIATLDAVSAGGALTVSGAGLTARSASAGSTLALTSTGDLTLGGGQAGGAATIDAGGLATLGQLVAGPSLSILASDAELNGTQRATAVSITNRAAATRALRLGDGTASDGFRLSAAELGRVDATTLTLDGGAGAVELGTTAFAAGAGSQAVRVFSTGAVTVDGAVTAAGTGRTITIGGAGTSPDATASAINIVATSAGGGRLMAPDNNLELRGGRIAAGLAAGFVDALTSGGTGTAANLVNNAASSLYNANLGGGFYDAGAGTVLSARSLTVRYTDYALFQNTGLPGTTAGVVLGGSMASPVAPALSLVTAGGAQNSFALFGTINGVGQTAAALLGPDVLSVGNANRATTRVNGCLIGTGGGCLTSVTIQPTLQVFHIAASDVFGAATDLTVPFDPVIGGGNEVMLNGTDLSATESPRVSGPPEPVVTGSAHP